MQTVIVTLLLCTTCFAAQSRLDQLTAQRDSIGVLIIAVQADTLAAKTKALIKADVELKKSGLKVIPKNEMWSKLDMRDMDEAAQVAAKYALMKAEIPFDKTDDPSIISLRSGLNPDNNFLERGLEVISAALKDTLYGR